MIQIKHIAIFLVCLIFVSRCVYANDMHIFAQANKLYAQKQFAQALALYATIKQKDAATWYNMGNSAYMSADYAQARLFWRRGQRSATSWSLLNDSAHNLKNLDRIQGLEKPESSIVFLRRVVSVVPLSTLQILFLLLWIMLIMAFARVRYVRSLRIPLFACVLAVAMMVTIRYTATSQCVGIVMEKEATVFAGPDENYHALAQIAQARELVLKDVDEHWCKVAHEQGTGWVKREAITIV